MDTLTALVCFGALFVIYRIIMVALERKGDLRATAQVGANAFSLEVRDKREATTARKLTDPAKT